MSDGPFAFIAACGPCWRESQSSPLGLAWTEFDEHGWSNLVCPIHGVIAIRADHGALDIGLVRENAEGQVNDFALFTEEWAQFHQADDGIVRLLESGPIEGGFVCGHCGAHTAFSGTIPPCSGCGR